MISQTDIIIYEALQLGLQDLRENLWLLDDIFSILTDPKFINAQKGRAELETIKNWFRNTHIPVIFDYTLDNPTFPNITISLGACVEKNEMKLLADLSPEIVKIYPEYAAKNLPPIVDRFVPQNINRTEQYIEVDDNFSFRGVRAGQYLLDLATGLKTKITKIEGRRIYFKNDDRLVLNELAIVPAHPYYIARREHTFFQENLIIGCHAAGNPLHTLWLTSIVTYLLLRFRESLLEAKYYTQSQISIGELTPTSPADNPGGDLIYSRYITLTGQVEYSWIKGLKRIVEKVELEHIKDNNGSQDIETGIRFLSNEDSQYPADIDQELWTTVKDDDQNNNE